MPFIFAYFLLDNIRFLVHNTILLMLLADGGRTTQTKVLDGLANESAMLIFRIDMYRCAKNPNNNRNIIRMQMVNDCSVCTNTIL